MQRNRRTWLGAALLAGIAHAASAGLLRLAGFDSLSDDDHARVVIAQSFVATPRLDPTGTSWLPAPFWLYGAAMMLLGSSLTIARVLAVVTAGASGALLVASGAAAGLDPRSSLLAAILPLFLPLVSFLGAAPVPELPAATAVAFALLHLASAREAPTWRWFLAAGFLTLASLSRYEAWIPTAFFALVTAFYGRHRPALLPASLLAAAGPLLWLLWNHHAHGHPLAFAHRVAVYRASLGLEPSGLLLYPRALLQEAPWALTLGLWATLRVPSMRLPIAGVGGLIVALALAELRGGAPTHHPERTLLAPIFVLIVASVAAIATLHGRGARPWVLLIALAGCFGALRWRPTREGLGADRRKEIALGLALRSALPPTERALLVADSFGFFAVQAALARPGSLQAVVPRIIDPRSTTEHDPLETRETLAEFLRTHPETEWLILRPGQAPWLPEQPGEQRLPGGRLLRLPLQNQGNPSR
ncbi:MAG: glycosyltransferase family 39 protein [Myxococcales bacterium]|nr:glycosyltransferase family 39 protein [Polyangiaceae bacterium]MDW8250005.1 glycosyltransferase family 39 protein [Myxococcales bacterium]